MSIVNFFIKNLPSLDFGMGISRKKVICRVAEKNGSVIIVNIHQVHIQCQVLFEHFLYVNPFNSYRYSMR